MAEGGQCEHGIPTHPPGWGIYPPCPPRTTKAGGTHPTADISKHKTPSLPYPKNKRLFSDFARVVPRFACKIQECILVGCVPAAHWPYAAVFFPTGGGSPWSRGDLPGARGVLLGPGGGLPGPGGGLLAPCYLVSGEPPPVNRITDTCKNITLATTSLRPVTIMSFETCSSHCLISTVFIMQTL